VGHDEGRGLEGGSGARTALLMRDGVAHLDTEIRGEFVGRHECRRRKDRIDVAERNSGILRRATRRGEHQLQRSIVGPPRVVGLADADDCSIPIHRSSHDILELFLRRLTASRLGQPARRPLAARTQRNQDLR
jgi:hypothetical protein